MTTNTHLALESKLSQMRLLHDELNQLLYKPETSVVINSPLDAAYLVYSQMTVLEHEEFWTILLNTRNRVIRIEHHFTGSLNSSEIRVGEVFKPAIRLNAAAIIAVHNHPSGDPTPSPDDVGITRVISKAGTILDIELLDHLVIAPNYDHDLQNPRFVSMKERGLGFS